MIYGKVVEYCMKNNISIAKFEKKCNIGNGTISKWEKGSKPSLDSLEKISAATGIQIDKWVRE